MRRRVRRRLAPSSVIVSQRCIVCNDPTMPRHATGHQDSPVIFRAQQFCLDQAQRSEGRQNFREIFHEHLCGIARNRASWYR